MPTRTTFAIAAACAALLAGCGSDNTPDPASTQATVDAADSATAQPTDATTEQEETSTSTTGSTTTSTTSAEKKKEKKSSEDDRVVVTGVFGKAKETGNDNGGSGSAPRGGSDSKKRSSGKKKAPAKVVKTGELTRSDREEIEAVRARLRELFDRLNRHDPDACFDLYTQRALEEATGRQGGEAMRKCRSDVRRAKGPAVKLNEIEGVRITGDKALIQFTSSAGGLAKRQILRMLKGNGRWRVDGDGSADAR